MSTRLGIGLVVIAAALGCARSRYFPHQRLNRASLVLDPYAKLVVNEPRILALSLAPPFLCDDETVRLAREGPALLEEEPTDIETFSDFRAIRSAGAYRVRTYAGLDLEKGPVVVVISGTETEDPAVSALNIANRYNDVAECLDRRAR